LRFGDNIYGRKPTTTTFKRTALDPSTLDNGAIYRTGNGSAGNIGAEALALIVTNQTGITAVRNPLPAVGGRDPESLEEVRQYAPQAFRRQERAVTTADYAMVAERHPEVQRAAATRRWTGSWHTMFITVDRMNGLPVDTAFEERMCHFIERYRLARHDVEIDGPRFVPLDIRMTVCVKPDYFRSEVLAALLKRFSSHVLPDGSNGFFHPDNFTFGQTVYLSDIIANAMAIAGVRWVDLAPAKDKDHRFQRWGEVAGDEFEQGKITMGRLEIAQLDNDPSQAENGYFEFYMEGGL
jgi:predicted phage baseplate assembly protein